MVFRGEHDRRFDQTSLAFSSLAFPLIRVSSSNSHLRGCYGYGAHRPAGTFTSSSSATASVYRTEHSARTLYHDHVPLARIIFSKGGHL